LFYQQSYYYCTFVLKESIKMFIHHAYVPVGLTETYTGIRDPG
jgi:hypothetical protein